MRNEQWVDRFLFAWRDTLFFDPLDVYYATSLRRSWCSRLTSRRAAGAGDDRWAQSPVSEVLTIALKLYRDGGLSTDEIIQLVQQLIGVVDDAKNEMIVHMDGLVEAELASQVERIMIEMADLELIMANKIIADRFASDALRAATRSKNYLNAVSDPKAADQIGFAIHVIYAVAQALSQSTNDRGCVSVDHGPARQHVLHTPRTGCRSRWSGHDSVGRQAP
jgi:hypothetical protein